MSKKKGASRSAMTLKDFHGGSIPSDLPLPSAPGMTVDRSVYERQGSGTWMSPTLGRGYGSDRSGFHRHGSSNGVRTFEDKSSYFPNPANIGRNYDEDERKPVDGRPRSSHSADRFDEGSYEERRGLYAADRYAFDDQGSFGGTSSFSEPRGSAISDRFRPSHVAGSGFDSDVYVHDEFGLIPVGPPPSRVPPQEPHPRQLPVPYPGDHSETRAEQLPYAQFQQTPSVPHQLMANSPPRSWKNPSHQAQTLASTPSVQPESATNVWTSRRDRDTNRPPSSETAGFSPWRPHGLAGRGLETRAVEKVSSGRWQSDASRIHGVHHERRTQFGTTISEGSQPRYSSEPIHGLPKLDPGRGMQSQESTQGGSDQRSGSEKTVYPPGGRDGLRGEFSNRCGSADEHGGGLGAYGATDVGQRSYVEEVWSSSGGFSETVKFNTDVDRADHSGTGRGGFKDVCRTSSESLLISSVENIRGLSGDDGRAELNDQTRLGFRDVSRLGLVSSNGRFSHFESGQSFYSDRPRDGEAAEGSSDPRQARYPENGRNLPEDGNNLSFGPGKQSWSPSTSERTAVELSEKARISASEGWRTGLSSYTLTTPSESSWHAASVEQSEPTERPKLKLLPRSKPLENEDLSNPESVDRSVYEEGNINVHRQLDDTKVPDFSLEATGLKRSTVKEYGISNEETDEEGNRRVERPKLNLKPRSQPAEAESDEGSQKVRQLVFGGARPRELVLKERGGEVSFNGSLDTAQTPVTASFMSSVNTGTKWEQTDIRIEKPENLEDEKPDIRRYEWLDRSLERQGTHRTDGQESSLATRVPENKWDLEKESQWDPERLDGRLKRELERPDTRRDTDSRRDIDKQESWRRPAEAQAVTIVSSVVDPSPRVAGRYGYSPNASAVELAQVFSRSSGMGSPLAGASRSLRSPVPVNSISKISFQGPGHGNGISGQHMSRDTPFSRLAEPSASQFGVGGLEMHLQGGSFALDSHTNSYNSAKVGTHGSGDLKRVLLAGYSDVAMGLELNGQNDDFPGKRGLPLRQKEGYLQ